MKLKMKMLTLVLGTFLLVPTMAMANSSIPNPNMKGEEGTAEYHHKKHYESSDKNWQKKMKQQEAKLLSLVDKYTPAKKNEWDKVIRDRNAIRETWLSPEYAEKRAQWKKDRMIKIEEYKKQYNEGKLSKEEFIKKTQGKAYNNWKLYHDLKQAVKNNDTKQSAALLNQLLVQYKKENQLMKVALKMS